MSEWRMAKSLEILREQINALSPNRDKSSDGGIGNAEHSARASDHNPDTDGVVKARDFTHDPAHGIDSQKLADKLLASRDPRIKYLISNRKIASGDAGPSPWVWRPYTGANPHDHHFHISVKADKAHYDSEVFWKLDTAVAPDVAAKPAEPETPLLKVGSQGEAVEQLQILLRDRGAYDALGTFDSVTQAAVEKFQRGHGLVADGVVGPYTLRKLKEA